MHTALRIPEILRMVFDFLDKTSNAGNAQVCKLWSEHALDVLWYDVVDLRRVFARLAPPKFASNLRFVSAMSPSSWSCL